MKISNEEVVERVMRMGIEHRNGVPFDGLFDLAKKQLSDNRRHYQSKKYSSLHEWWKAEPHKFAFMYIKNVLQVIRVTDLANVSFVEWRNDSWPLVKLKHEERNQRKNKSISRQIYSWRGGAV